MAPSGEVFFTKDRYGVIRQHRRLGICEPVEVNSETVEWVIHHYGYDRVDEDLANWAEVEAFVDDAIPKATMLADDLPVNVVIARSAVRVLERWLASPTDVLLVVPTVNRLLGEPTVRNDADLSNALLTLSSRAAEMFRAPTSGPLLRARTSDGVGMGRRQRQVNDYFAAERAA